MRCYIFTLYDCGRTLNAQEIDCNNAEEALQLGSPAVANDPVEVWCGPRRLARFEPERRQERPLSRLRERLIVAERRLHEGEQHISEQERVIAQLKREGRDLALAFSILDTLIETQKAHLRERDLLVAEVAKRSG
ncbi:MULTISPECIES: hypothetical protein [Bradyrhizobium]|uniref:hypothetical protein n=1 Tax=Bradyrhizobium centrosematis TaxID=1300039 RepID=UPI002166C33C|nr:hypothetical protein [Bradyrhizobium centrosematis]MCS3765800.1 hypothetical protein [Bradyrhizobium centrosematis]MCS3778320.1 hypothetical protein [Bradyrhizobium centrosematis]